jgi:hypothetical protein
MMITNCKFEQQRIIRNVVSQVFISSHLENVLEHVDAKG